MLKHVYDELTKEYLYSEEFGIGIESVSPELPNYDKLTQSLYYEVNVNQWGIYPRRTLNGLSINEAKELISSKITEERYRVETSGIELNGSIIKTDRESQSQVTSAYISLKNGLTTSVDFKGANGWIVLTLIEMEAIASALTSHVQKCFSAEKKHLEAIGLLTTIDELKSYDYKTNFLSILETEEVQNAQN